MTNDTERWFTYSVRWMREGDEHAEPISCHSVEHSDGMVRFVDTSGTVILAIGSNYLIDYKLLKEVGE